MFLEWNQELAICGISLKWSICKIQTGVTFASSFPFDNSYLKFYCLDLNESLYSHCYSKWEGNCLH